MQKNILLVLLIISNYAIFAQKTAKVLFIGNSYTYVNDLPGLISSLADSSGDVLIKDQNTPGGYTFNQHSTNATTLSKISSNNWDFVILQEQSQLPSFPPSQVEDEVFPYAQILNDSIISNDSCTKTLFFMTWGRQNGDQDNCQYYQPLCTYEGMQSRLRESYLQMGIDNFASVAPVGIAWKRTREITGDSINLYSSDGSHPSNYGSYLAACVFYACIFNKSPAGNSFIYNLPENTAALLQQIADSIVFDSTFVWNHRKADFMYNQNNNEVNFISTKNFIQEEWDFGDGSPVSNEHNPIHFYSNTGTFTVKHIINSYCISDTVSSTVNILETEIINPLSNKQKLIIAPNPAINVIMINIHNKGIKIYSIDGKHIKTYESNNSMIDVSDLPNGIYLIKIKTEYGITTGKFIVRHL